jgi:hypothetical protein
VPACIIPHSVVRLSLTHVTSEFVAGLLATRSTRVLQTVKFATIDDCTTAALVAELVSTDPAKQWRLSCGFAKKAGVAFCGAATAAHTASQASSLTALRVATDSQTYPFAELLAAVPTITSIVIACTDWVGSMFLIVTNTPSALSTDSASSVAAGGTIEG